MSLSSTIQRVQGRYATWEHALFWLGIVVNFFVFYLVIYKLSAMGWFFPVFQAVYLPVCFMAYIKGFKALNIITPLFVVSGVIYMAFNLVV
ncbi:MAG: hypothetical protein AAEF23_06385 [Gammaproteobacteria bacterium]